MIRPRWIPFLAAVLTVGSVTFAQETGPAVDPKERLRVAEEALPDATKDRLRAVREFRSIRDGVLDKEGILWIATSHGVLRIEGETITRMTEKDGLSHDFVSAVLEDQKGVLWFGTANGLTRYDRKDFTHIPLPWKDIHGDWIAGMYPLLDPNHAASLKEAADGGLWVGTLGGGVYRYDGKDFQNFLHDKGKEYDDGQHHNWITSIEEDHQGNLWFGSMSWGGATRYDGSSFKEFQVEDGLSDYMIRIIFQARDGKLWFGSNGNREGGVDRFDGKEFTNFQASNGHAHKHTASIYQDRSGSLWFACGFDGICTFDGEGFRSFSEEQGQAFERINFFVEDAAGHLWFGGGKNELYRFDGETVTDYSERLPE
ncbi:MAG: ligand-binding sensor domain-containing protein [Planctomycetota bacterium]